jgi:hypothetical protein
MKYHDWLLRRANRYWRKGESLPLDLFMELVGAGLDVEALEKQHQQTE